MGSHEESRRRRVSARPHARRPRFERLENRYVMTSFVGGSVEPLDWWWRGDCAPIFVANPDGLTVAAGTESRAQVLRNDYHIDHEGSDQQDGLRILEVSAPEHGTAAISDNGRTIAYTPNADFLGIDRFQYTLINIDGETDTADVLVHVVPTFTAVEDWFLVDPSESGATLDVLANDRQYAQQAQHTAPGADELALTIVAVEAGEAAGAVSIAEDARNLVYTPATDFTGLDTISYVVEDAAGNRTAAEVRVRVVALADPASRADAELAVQEALDQSHLEQTLVTHTWRYGSLDTRTLDTTMPSCHGIYLYDDVAWYRSFDLALSPAVIELSAVQDASASQTNVQVDGVDEADLVKTDREFLYVLSNRQEQEQSIHELIIIDVRDPEDPSIAARHTFDAKVVGQYLVGDRLAVITQDTSYDVWADDPWLVRPTIYPYYNARLSEVHVTVFDVSDRTSPEVLAVTRIDGGHLESRAIDDQLFLVTEPNLERWPSFLELETIHDDASGARFYESPQQHLERLRPHLEQRAGFVASLPQFETVAGDGQVVAAGTLGDPTELMSDAILRLAEGRAALAAWRDSSSLLSIAVIDVGDATPTVVDGEWLASSYSQEIYASTSAFYVFDHAIETDGRLDWNDTRVVKFDLSSGGDPIRRTATGIFEGQVLNSFSVDEYDGYLRVATTVGFGRESENNVYVLRQDGADLELVGSLEGLAATEQIYSVRFVGDRAFVVTFRQVDPLFVIDLSDPTAPSVAGELKVPGYSNYLQLIDEHLLLGIGRDADAMGIFGGLQVSLFDVSDMGDPLLIDRYEFPGGRSTWSPVVDGPRDLGTHHAVSYFTDERILALPVYSRANLWGETSAYDGVAVEILTVDANEGFTQLGQIPFASTGDRSAARTVRIGDTLLSITPELLQANLLRQPAEQLAALPLTSSARDDHIETDEGESVTFDPRDNDGMSRDEMRRISVRIPELTRHGGQLALDDEGRVQFTPPTDFVGRETFDYSIEFEDGRLESAQVTVDVRWPWHNPTNRHDANGDGHVTTLDALVGINWLNRFGPQSVADPEADVQFAVRDGDRVRRMHVDVNGDGAVTARDILQVINRLTGAVSDTAGEGEGEFEADGKTAPDPRINLFAQLGTAPATQTFAEFLLLGRSPTAQMRPAIDARALYAPPDATTTAPHPASDSPHAKAAPEEPLQETFTNPLTPFKLPKSPQR